VKCGQHYHIDRLIDQMTQDRAALATGPEDSFLLPAKVPARAVHLAARPTRMYRPYPRRE